MRSHIIAGVDLAWMGARNPTAIAVGAVEPGVVRLSSILEGLYGTQSVIEALDSISGLHGVAVDGPLIIRNQSGQRECERMLSVVYGGRKASCHTSNLNRFPDPAGVELSLHLEGAGFRHIAPTGQKWQLECYPHPAMIEMFGLPERLAYKKGTSAQKRSGQINLSNLIRSLESSTILRLQVPEGLDAYLESTRILSLRGLPLKQNEDVLDAIICMYIGALYQSGQDRVVFGNSLGGYIYVPVIRCIGSHSPSGS